MLYTLLAILLILWVAGFAMDVAGGFIHLLLVVAAVIFLLNLLTGRRTTV
ncbi:MAG: lmo0937 family membrane protein [Vicinamibacterales bacterium]